MGDAMKKTNYTLMCDFYELTMCNGYLVQGLKDKICYYDYFFRTVPDNGGFAISCGLEQIVEYIQNLHFTEEASGVWKAEDLRAGFWFIEGFPFYRRHLEGSGRDGHFRTADFDRARQGDRSPVHRNLSARDHESPKPDCDESE